MALSQKVHWHQLISKLVCFFVGRRGFSDEECIKSFATFEMI